MSQLSLARCGEATDAALGAVCDTFPSLRCLPVCCGWLAHAREALGPLPPPACLPVSGAGLGRCCVNLPFLRSATIAALLQAAGPEPVCWCQGWRTGAPGGIYPAASSRRT